MNIVIEIPNSNQGSKISYVINKFVDKWRYINIGLIDQVIVITKPKSSFDSKKLNNTLLNVPKNQRTFLKRIGYKIQMVGTNGSSDSLKSLVHRLNDYERELFLWIDKDSRVIHKIRPQLKNYKIFDLKNPTISEKMIADRPRYFGLKESITQILSDSDNITTLNIKHGNMLSIGCFQNIAKFQNSRQENSISFLEVDGDLVKQRFLESFKNLYPHTYLINISNNLYIMPESIQLIIITDYEELSPDQNSIMISQISRLVSHKYKLILLGRQSKFLNELNIPTSNRTQLPEFRSNQKYLYECLLVFLDLPLNLFAKASTINTSLLNYFNKILLEAGSFNKLLELSLLFRKSISKENFPTDYLFWYCLTQELGWKDYLPYSKLKKNLDKTKNDKYELLKAVNQQKDEYEKEIKNLRSDKYKLEKTLSKPHGEISVFKAEFNKQVEIIFKGRVIIPKDPNLIGFLWIYTLMYLQSKYPFQNIHVDQLAEYWYTSSEKSSTIPYTKKEINRQKNEINELEQKTAKTTNPKLIKKYKEEIAAIKSDIKSKTDIHGNPDRTSTTSESNYKKISIAMKRAKISLKEFKELYDCLNKSVKKVPGVYAYRFNPSEDIDWILK
ncbi:MAG: hypothetical protein NTZ27_05245 [Ignavibacteriales bacterium]|nr:hypothetical protein [Ignavibacteriales bacterium]